MNQVYVVHSIRQQLGVAERANRSTPEDITVLLSHSGLAEIHWLYGTIRIPFSATKPLHHSSSSTVVADVFFSRLFGCLAYVHLQQYQHPALASHATQCVP